MAVDKNDVVLGSGKLYGVEYDAVAGIPTDLLFETDANTFGRIKGGAELSYKPTVYEVVDDEGERVRSFITKEEVTFKSGVLTWALANIAKLSPATVTEAAGVRTLTLGGSKALTEYALRFVHTKADGKKLRVTMVATAGSGFTLKFDAEKETVIDAEFSALSQDDGTLVAIAEDFVAA